MGVNGLRCFLGGKSVYRASSFAAWCLASAVSWVHTLSSLLNHRSILLAHRRHRRLARLTGLDERHDR